MNESIVRRQFEERWENQMALGHDYPVKKEDAWMIFSCGFEDGWYAKSNAPGNAQQQVQADPIANRTCGKTNPCVQCDYCP